MTEIHELSLEFGRKHPFRMALWWLAEWAVSTCMGIQSDIEDQNRAALWGQADSSTFEDLGGEGCGVFPVRQPPFDL